MDRIQLAVIEVRIVDGFPVVESWYFTGTYEKATEAARLHSWEVAKKHDPNIGEWDCFRCPFGNWSVVTHVLEKIDE